VLGLEADLYVAAFVEGVDEVDVARGDELVFDEDGGGSRRVLCGSTSSLLPSLRTGSI